MIKIIFAIILGYSVQLTYAQEVLPEATEFLRIRENCSPLWALRQVIGSTEADALLSKVPGYSAELARTDPNYSTQVFSAIYFQNTDLPTTDIFNQSKECLFKQAALAAFLPQMRTLSTLRHSMDYSIDAALSSLKTALEKSGKRKLSPLGAAYLGQATVELTRLQINLSNYQPLAEELVNSVERAQRLLSVQLVKQDAIWVPSLRAGSDAANLYSDHIEKNINLPLWADSWDDWGHDTVDTGREKNPVALISKLITYLEALKESFQSHSMSLFGVRAQNNPTWLSDWMMERQNIQDFVNVANGSPSNKNDRAYRLGLIRGQYEYTLAFHPEIKAHAPGYPGYSKYESDADSVFESFGSKVAEMKHDDDLERLLQATQYTRYVDSLIVVSSDFIIKDIHYRSWAARQMRNAKINYLSLSEEEILAHSSLPWWGQFMRIVNLNGSRL